MVNLNDLDAHGFFYTVGGHSPVVINHVYKLVI